MENELISIIIPVYNSIETLERCIDSVLKQDYQNLEIILINDGSTDKSDLICKHYLKIDNRVKFYEQKNKGVSYSRNQGIKYSSGSFLMFIDSDDYVDETLCSKLLYEIRKTNTDLVICGYDFIFEKNENVLSSKKVIPEIKNIYNKIDLENTLGKLYDNKIMASPWGKLYRNSFIKKNNIVFNENLSLGEDMIFVQDYLLNTNSRSISVVNEALYKYIISNANSLSNKFDVSKKKSVEIILKKSFAFCHSMDIVNKVMPHVSLNYFRGMIINIQRMLESNARNIDKINYIKSIKKSKSTELALKYINNNKPENIAYLISFKMSGISMVVILSQARNFLIKRMRNL